jgi:hypothetical protein
VKHIKKRELTEYIFHKLFGIKPVFAAVSTFYPDPDAESTSVDGVIVAGSGMGHATAQDAWNIVTAATTGTASPSGGSYDLSSSVNYFVRGDSYNASLGRVFLLFDTSSLSSSASISSATLSIYVTAKINGDNSGFDSVNVVTTTPASNTDLVSTDYDDITSTLQASAVDLSAISTSAYNNFALNATGLGNIAKTGVTKFGLRTGEDIADDRPVTDTENTVTISAAETSGTSQDPKLEVTYTVANFSVGQWFPF